MAENSERAYAEDLLYFIAASPSPFHAVRELVRRLENSGFTELFEQDEWQVEAGDRHYVIREDSSLIAFVVGQSSPVDSGFDIVGAHTDSPCLKLKPRPALHKNGYVQLGVEPYGGLIHATWTDRDLSLAGRVVRRNGTVDLVRSDDALLRIPNLAIHLNREVNSVGMKFNPQTQLVPVLALSDDKEAKDNTMQVLWKRLLGKKIDSEDIADFDLCLYDLQPGSLSGQNEEFIHAARLDNLASCHAGVEALIEASEKDSKTTRVLVCFDHEEVGSESAQGAAGPFLRDTLERLAAHAETAQGFHRALAKSFCISADMAHAVHPNFADLHDGEHMPRLGQGPVIKHNVNQRYATSSKSAARLLRACKDAGIKPQRFVTRSDLQCGSTIGPITAAKLGISTVDIGNPMLSMHSIREMAAAADVQKMVRLLTKFWK